MFGALGHFAAKSAGIDDTMGLGKMISPAKPKDRMPLNPNTPGALQQGARYGRGSSSLSV